MENKLIVVVCGQAEDYDSTLNGLRGEVNMSAIGRTFPPLTNFCVTLFVGFPKSN